MKRLSHAFTASLALALLIAANVGAADGSSKSSESQSLSVVIMDPLAAPLSCPCVEGYAQRKYEVLGKHLEEALGRPVTVTFAESLKKALAKDNCPHADLIIGKDSVVRSDGVRAGYTVKALARLTDQKGKTTQTGLIVVRSKDPAKKVEDLKGYRILFGGPECDEKFAAPRAMLANAGIEVVPAAQAETTAACSDGACKIIEWGDSQQAAAVISSYAAPLLEGCGTIDKGDLRVIGETAPVPFITAFTTGRVDMKASKRIEQALLSLMDHPKLLVALESETGFVAIDKKYIKSYGKMSKPKKPAKPKAKESAAWDGFMGPTRNGHVPWLPEVLPQQPKVAWSIPLLRPGVGGVAADEKIVIFGDRDPSNNLDVWRCLDAQSGDEVWTVEYPAIGRLDYDNLPRATPVLSRGKAYLLGAFGDLTRVDIASGGIDWQTNIRVAFGADYELKWGACSTPLLVDGKLIVNPGGPDASLVALDPLTGDTLWQTPGGRHAYASPIVATLGGVRQIVTYDNQSLGGWDPATGRRLWTLEPPLPGDFNVPTPVVISGKLLIVSENNGARLHGFDKTGKINQKPDAIYSRLKPDMSTPVVAAGRVFCVNDKLICLDAATLKPIWTGARRSFAGYAPLIASGDRLLAVALGGQLQLIDAAANKYTVLSQLSPFGKDKQNELYGTPALVGDRLYLRGEDSLVCLRLGAS